MKSAILFLTDKRGFPLTEHALTVALITQTTMENMIIFCVGFAPPMNQRIREFAAKRGIRVEYRTLADHVEVTHRHKAHGAHGHVTSTTMLKMALLEAVSAEFDIAAYVDNDILLMRDFDLSNIDFEGHAIAAVYDIAKCGALAAEAGFAARCSEHGRSVHYFNGGLLVANFKRWSPDFARRYAEAVDAHSKHCDYQNNCSADDQCAFNVVFERAWKRLPLTMNFQACAIFSKGWDDATLRHYVGPQKFLPFKAWRNDSADTILINQARDILGLGRVGFPLAPLVRRANAIRNRKFATDAGVAVKKVELMFSDAM